MAKVANTDPAAIRRAVLHLADATQNLANAIAIVEAHRSDAPNALLRSMDATDRIGEAMQALNKVLAELERDE